MANKSKFFRIAVEGGTTDGRVIERTWLEQIAQTFKRETYGARVWLEHLRSLLPDSPFKAYGDVLAVKTEEFEINGQKRLALLAQIDATPELIGMNKARQKIYTSCEIDPNFADSGKAYLVGLAVTDSPASLGTEMLAFAAGAQANPLAERKQRPENLFTEAVEVALEIETEDKPFLGEQLFAKVKALLVGEKKDTDARFADQAQAVEAVAQSQSDLLKQYSALEARLGELDAKAKQNADALEAHKAEFSALETRLGSESGTPARPPAAGCDGMIKTDC